ncbi:hypothetical protein HDC90_002164 [Pedobacter sp. AK013]|nr:hypothetical protein [Pedobacter sp. AK013]
MRLTNWDDGDEKILNSNGYYYSVYDRSNITDSKQGKGIYMKIFLENGFTYTVRNGYGSECGKVVDLSCEISVSERMLTAYLESPKSKKINTMDIWNWGKYKIIKDSILIQTYYNHQGDYYLKEEVGERLAPSSFRILQIRDYRTDKVEKVNRIFNFKIFDVHLIQDKVPQNKVFRR